MNDKSPRQQMSKSGKTIKEKRADKRSKQSAASTIVPPTHKKK